MSKASYNTLGLMSGTSLDGLDICQVQFELNQGKWSHQILQAETISYSKEWLNRLKRSSQLSVSELKQLDLDYGKYLGEQTLTFIQKNKIRDLDLIGSHGHTVFHQPEKGFTLQIGNTNHLAKTTLTTTVCDFRVQDISLGGQGAPLVPIGDRLLFNEYPACLNLGGFSNISFEQKKQRLAFDICPVNLIFNEWAEKTGQAYDENGSIAQSGKIIPFLLSQLNDLAYYSSPPPKSLGIEWLLKNIQPLLSPYHSPTQIPNVMATVCEHAAMQISKTLNHYKLKETLITGGGAYHSFLLERIQAHTAHRLVLPDRKSIDFKEAVIFAFLGVLKIRQENNCLASVTGAKHDHSSGVVYQF